MYIVTYRGIIETDRREAISLVGATDVAAAMMRCYGRQAAQMISVECPDGEILDHATACERAGVFG